MGTYTAAIGTFAQQVDQGSIFDEELATGVATASGSGVEDYAFDESGTATVTASGSGVESYLTTYDAAVEADNPVSHWKLGGSTALAVDRKGVRNLPALNGPIATSTGLVANNAGGLANNFVAASNQVFTAGAAADNRGAPYNGGTVTVEAWVKLASLGNAFICSRNGAADLQVLSNGVVRSAVTIGGSLTSIDSAAGVIVAGVLYHLVATYDGANVIIYRNGVEVKRQALTGSLDPSLTEVPAIGARRDSVAAANGDIDEAAWYNTALSAARVLAHYQAGTTSYTDSGAGTVVASGSSVEAFGFGATGTITASGTGTEAASYADSRTATVVASGSGVEDYTSYYSSIVNVTPGLVSYWRLSDSSGAAVDEKGVSDGTYIGSVTRDASGLIPPDTAAAFPGTAGNYINVPSQTAYDTGAQLTVEAWFRPTALSGVTQKIAARSAGSTVWFVEITSNTKLRWYLRDANLVDTFIQDVATLVVGQLYHVVGTYDAAGTMKLYINGVASATAQNRTPNANVRAGTGEAIVIGAEGASVAPFNGIVDEVAIYNVALDAGTVASHYRVGVDEVSDPPSTTYDDSRTATVTASGSRAESAAHSGSGTATATASGSGAESSTTADSGLTTITATGSGVEAYIYSDAGSATATASGSGAESSTADDSRTATATASGSGVEVFQPPVIYTDSASATVTASGNGTESYTGSVTYTDVASATVTASGSGVEGQVFTEVDYIGLETSGHLLLEDETGGVLADTQTATATASGTGVESAAHSGSANATATASGASAESTTHSGSASATATASGTGVEFTAYADSANATATASGTGVEFTAYADSGSATATVSGSGTENFQPPVTYTDSRTATVTATGGGTEGYETVAGYEDERTGTVAANGAVVEAFAHSATASGTVTASGTGAESATYTDSATATTTANGSDVESVTYADSASATVAASGSGVESAAYADSRTGVATSTGTSVEVTYADDSGSATASAGGTGVEFTVYADSASATAITSGTGDEFYELGIVYTDTASGTITVSGEGTESYEDTASGAFTATGSGVESVVYDDSQEAVFIASGTGESFEGERGLAWIVTGSTYRSNTTGVAGSVGRALIVTGLARHPGGRSAAGLVVRVGPNGQGPVDRPATIETGSIEWATTSP